MWWCRLGSDCAALRWCTPHTHRQVDNTASTARPTLCARVRRLIDSYRYSKSTVDKFNDGDELLVSLRIDGVDSNPIVQTNYANVSYPATRKCINPLVNAVAQHPHNTHTHTRARAHVLQS